MLNQNRTRLPVILFAILFYWLMGSQVHASGPLTVLDSYIAAWNSHDAKQCAEHFDKGIVFYDATVGKPVTGKENAKNEIVASFMTAVPDLKLKREKEVLIQGDNLIWKWSFSGTNTGNWSDGTKATNKNFKIKGLTWMKLKNDKIIYSGDYYDAYGFYQQLGMVE